MSAWALEFSSKFLIGTLFALMRWSCGSLLGPVLAHNASNVVVTLASGRIPRFFGAGLFASMKMERNL